MCYKDKPEPLMRTGNAVVHREGIRSSKAAIYVTDRVLIGSYGAPDGVGRCPVAQGYNKRWATLV